MNERIKELAEQSGYGARWTTTEQFEQFMEKFAEMLVKECMKQVRDEVQYEYDWKLADAVTKRVMEHFGVEE